MSESEATITFRVGADLKKRFSQRARQHDRAGSQLLRDFMRNFVDQAGRGSKLRRLVPGTGAGSVRRSSQAGFERDR